MDEDNAIQRLKLKDMGGLKWLVDHYYSRVLQVASLITGDLPMAEDVAQETFLNLFHSINQFDEKRPFSPWLMRCVINLAVQTSQKRKKQVSLDAGEGIDLFERMILPGLSPEDSVISTEFKQYVREALNQLSPRQRVVVVQRYFLEMSEKEMGRDLEIAPGTVKWLLNAARKKLQVALKRERDDL